MISEIKKCRFCEGEDLFLFLDLGITPLADAFLDPSTLKQRRSTEIYVPLSVLSCKSCGLAQLSHVVSARVLYDQSYAYDASVTSTGRSHWRSLAHHAWDRFACSTGELVIDVGSNSGELLSHFKDLGANELGVDPAPIPTKLAASRGISTLNALFEPSIIDSIINSHGKARIITATNVFAHIDKVKEFFHCVDSLLVDKGVLIIEAPHFLELIKRLEYDTIYHEHLSYLAVKPLQQFVKRMGFRLFDAERYPIHGGTLRYYIAREGDYIESPSVARIQEEEVSSGIYDQLTLRAFSSAVSENRKKLRELLINLKQQGSRIAAVGAPAKGMTLINYCGIGLDLLDFITEKSPLKIGSLAPGMHIPILPDSELIKQKPDYCLLLAWNFAEEIISNLSDYRKNGGRFIVPIPSPRLI